MKILIKAPFSPYSGYGNDGIGIALGLVEAGHDVYLQPTHVDAPLPPALASLLTKRLSAPFDLSIVHVDPGQMECSPEMRRASTCVIGWTMWEYTTFDNLRGRNNLRKRLRNFDALVAYDDVTAGALQPYISKDTALITQQGGYDPEPWPQVDRDWHGSRFGFCMVGALHDRKDPFVAIEAFRELKTEYPEEFEPAELHLKTNIPGLHPKMEQWTPKLRVHYDVWPTSVLRDFYSAQHVLLAPSRGEGKNVPALEMLTTGGTVIATNWGGHTQWLRDEIGYKLNYVLRPEAANKPNCMSARASKDHLKELMLHTFRNRTEAKRKGEYAAQLIPQTCSWSVVIDGLMNRMRQANNGERIYSLYRMAS